MMNSGLSRGRSESLRFWPAIVAWAVGWLALLAMDGQVDLANLAMLLVLSSAVAALWLPVAVSVVSNVVAVLAFNLLGDGLRDAADPYSQ